MTIILNNAHEKSIQLPDLFVPGRREGLACNSEPSVGNSITLLSVVSEGVKDLITQKKEPAKAGSFFYPMKSLKMHQGNRTR